MAREASGASDDDPVVIDLGGGDPPVLKRSEGRTSIQQAHVEPRLDLVNPAPAPKRLAPAHAAPELEDMSRYAPANQYRPRVPSTDSGEGFVERTCSKCGYSLEGLESDVCPECGHSNQRRRRSKSQVLAEESKRIARMEYLKPVTTLGIGAILVIAILLATGDFTGALGWVAGLPIRVAIGTFAYFLCCLWFFGSDAPWHLSALRIAATYAISDIPIAAVGLIGFGPAYPLAYVVGFALCAMMFVWLFELDPADAWLLVTISTVVNVVIGFGLAVMISMIV